MQTSVLTLAQHKSAINGEKQGQEFRYVPLKVFEAVSSKDLYVDALEEIPPTGDSLPPRSISYSESTLPDANPRNIDVNL